MDAVGVYEAKTHLAKLLDRVANGEWITITRHGVPVALLSPANTVPSPDVEEAIKSIMEIGRGRTTGGMTIREMIEEGRP